MDVTSSLQGRARGTVVSGMVQCGPENSAANLVIEDLEEFSAVVYTLSCWCAADYVFDTSAASNN